ncbi:guanine-specific ribonuclease N1 and T1 [Streptomyces sp. R302]|uniref:ribonuclease domain-containing protein n=1 Tax=unclassified Streptomyces TaxID=2593676 RepID=UPI00145D5EB9|nr:MULTISPECIES: ribonuclease domain-containing protein [unclassified Streptomyces]NML53626.1 guanine-specific ribonuclease N1 and T1 [Streptomyces sp. R301]NML81987.1 guanine-specific ribonuclease N1 and T1 [Streptomyces sp. R302]
MIARCLRPGLAVLAGLTLLLTGCSSGTATPTATAAPSRTAATVASAPVSDLPTVRESELPPEARRTLALIRAGGPFPYGKDGSVFSNFERILPPRKRGYYHEYTVRTPGERDRGARRIVTGGDGERYYTDDHYESFREVVGDEAR